MKKILCLFLIFIMIFGISGCRMYNEKNDKLQIVTTIFPYYSFAKEICGNDAEITMLLKPGTESHTFEPTTQDILTIKNADIFIYTGGESDKWVDTILSSVDTSKTKIIKAIDLVEPIHEEHHNEYDEHIWTSVKNAVIITETIYNATKNEQYAENKNQFVKKLNEMGSEFKNLLNSTDKTLIFADRFPFSYFAKDYNFKYVSAFPSCSEESEPSVQTMTEIINTVKEENIPYVFYIEFSNQKIADTIQSETGAGKLLFHSCHNVTNEEFNSGATYLSLMEQNLENLKEALR